MSYEDGLAMTAIILFISIDLLIEAKYTCLKCERVFVGTPIGALFPAFFHMLKHEFKRD